MSLKASTPATKAELLQAGSTCFGPQWPTRAQRVAECLDAIAPERNPACGSPPILTLQAPGKTWKYQVEIPEGPSPVVVFSVGEDGRVLHHKPLFSSPIPESPAEIALAIVEYSPGVRLRRLIRPTL